jgi:hypothetical protein
MNFGQSYGLLRLYTLSKDLHVRSYAIIIANVYARQMLRNEGQWQYARHTVEQPLPVRWALSVYIGWKAASLLNPERGRTPKADFQIVVGEKMRRTLLE